MLTLPKSTEKKVNIAEPQYYTILVPNENFGPASFPNVKHAKILQRDKINKLKQILNLFND
jgi:hypothetical protein